MKTSAARVATAVSGAQERGWKPRLRRSGILPLSERGWRPRLRRLRGGFSLSEILIATAILGVGLVMVMAVFPAALDTNKDSTNDVLGTIICENGLSVVKSRFTHTELSLAAAEVGTTFSAGQGTPDGTGLSLGAGDRSYPSGDAGRLRGFLVLARQVTSGQNDYQFVIVSYLKTASANQVRAFALSASLDANAMVFSAGATTYLRLGSPVIDPATGAYATIVSFSGSTVTLDHPIDRSRPVGTTIADPLVIVETNSSGTPLSIPISPATHVVVARAALRP